MAGRNFIPLCIAVSAKSIYLREMQQLFGSSLKKTSALAFGTGFQ